MTVLLPGFLDAHAHLALIDPTQLAAGGIARVLDLGGWWPAADAPGGVAAAAALGVAGTDAVPSAAGAADAAGPDARYAGQFLGAPGGYPSRQAWAPAGSACAVGSPGEAAGAVARQAAGGASVIKVTLNSAAGPVLDTATLAAIVAAAHERMLPVAAHTEGPGQADAAFTAGVDLLAHTPFTDRLPGELLGRMAGRLTWISTLDIHGWGEPTAAFHVASDNLARFHTAGGRVLYGTDLGNGPLPVGLNRREIAALLACGLSPDDVLAALTADYPGYPNGPIPAAVSPARPSASTPALALAPALAPGVSPAGARRVTVIPGDRPTDPHDLTGFIDWLLRAQALPAHALPAHAQPARALPRPDLEDHRS
ncbi:hypothetical protein [Cryobacterium sp. W22_MBD10_FK3]|uniref:hypothetical protein n=1 Tax=Cryobacterium sp. W22_MBD10_FK3 TaxID=3240273 RepID=UPI003F93E8D5